MSIYKMSKNDAILVNNSSRGSQIKFCKEGYWYKLDETGPEGAAEALTSIILDHSSLQETEYVKYELCDIEYEGKIYTGCRSKNFLKEDEIFVSYAKIYSMLYGKALNEEVTLLSSPNERIDFVCDVIKEFSDLDVHDYIGKVATLDMLILNTDRHFHNLGIITDKNYENARNGPIFDNGAAFLSNYVKNPPDILIENIDVHTNVFGMPFSPDLEYQAVCAGLSVKFDFAGIKKYVESDQKLSDSRMGKILLRQIETYRKVPALIQVSNTL